MKKGPEGNPEWKSYKRNRLKREQTFPSGMKRVETILPKFNYKTIVDSFPNAERHLYAVGKIEAGLEAEIQDAIFHIHGPRVLFEDLEMEISGNNDIVISLGNSEKTKKFPNQTEKDLVRITYSSNGGFKECQLQAEALAQKLDEPMPWREALPILLNLIRTEDPQKLSTKKGVAISLYNHHLDGVPEETKKIIIPRIDKFTTLFLEEILKTIHPEDSEECLQLLMEAGTDCTMKDYLLTDFENKVSKINIDKFLDFLIHAEIFMLTEIKEPQRIIKLTPFSKTMFSWQDIDSEGGESSEKEEVKVESTDTYGSTVDSQGNKFKIDKNGNSIIIVCSTKTGKSWTVTFPLALPAKNIVNIINDLDGDFRRVRDLAPVSFKKNTKPQ